MQSIIKEIVLSNIIDNNVIDNNVIDKYSLYDFARCQEYFKLLETNEKRWNEIEKNKPPLNSGYFDQQICNWYQLRTTSLFRLLINTLEFHKQLTYENLSILFNFDFTYYCISGYPKKLLLKYRYLFESQFKC